MKKTPIIKQIMTPFPHSISGSATIKQAREVMSRHSIRHLPVVTDGWLVGILTDRDLKLVQAVTKAENFAEKYSVKDCCRYDGVYIVSALTRADEVLSYMATNRIGSALITEAKKLVGIFTVTDACRSFVEFLRSE
jgi:acetoin utilization protein AcuB